MVLLFDTLLTLQLTNSILFKFTILCFVTFNDNKYNFRQQSESWQIGYLSKREIEGALVQCEVHSGCELDNNQLYDISYNTIVECALLMISTFLDYTIENEGDITS